MSIRQNWQNYWKSTLVYGGLGISYIKPEVYYTELTSLHLLFPGALGVGWQDGVPWWGLASCWVLGIAARAIENKAAAALKERLWQGICFWIDFINRCSFLKGMWLLGGVWNDVGLWVFVGGWVDFLQWFGGDCWRQTLFLKLREECVFMFVGFGSWFGFRQHHSNGKNPSSLMWFEQKSTYVIIRVFPHSSLQASIFVKVTSPDHFSREAIYPGRLTIHWAVDVKKSNRLLAVVPIAREAGLKHFVPPRKPWSMSIKPGSFWQLFFFAGSRLHHGKLHR